MGRKLLFLGRQPHQKMLGDTSGLTRKKYFFSLHTLRQIPGAAFGRQTIWWKTSLSNPALCALPECFKSSFWKFPTSSKKKTFLLHLDKFFFRNNSSLYFLLFKFEMLNYKPSVDREPLKTRSERACEIDSNFYSSSRGKKKRVGKTKKRHLDRVFTIK